MITMQQLEAATRSLDDREWHRFAERVAEIDPVLGVTVQLHADAAAEYDDEDVPLVSEFPSQTMDDAVELVARGIKTKDAARRWWREQYGDQDLLDLPEASCKLCGKPTGGVDARARRFWDEDVDEDVDEEDSGEEWGLCADCEGTPEAKAAGYTHHK